MKRFVITLFFIIVFIAKSFAQFKITTKLNEPKDKLLILREDSNHEKKIIYYDINMSRIIRTYSFNSQYERIDFDFSPNSKIFSVLATYVDTNFKHKNWKPNRYYLGYYPNVSEDSGWHTDKKVTLSSLNFYDANNGSYLFNIKDTVGFYYYELSNGNAPFKMIGNYKLPTYIKYAKFIPNSDSLFLTFTLPNNTGFKDQRGEKLYIKPYYNIWNLNNKKSIGRTYVLNEIFSSKDKKNLFSIGSNYFKGNNLKQNIENEISYNEVNLHSNKGLKIKEYLPKLNLDEYKLKRDQKYITDSAGNEYIISCLSEKKQLKTEDFFYLKYFQVYDLSGKLIWRFYKQDFTNLVYKAIPNSSLVSVTYCKDSSFIVELINWKTNDREKLLTVKIDDYRFYSNYSQKFAIYPRLIFNNKKKFVFYYTKNPFFYDKNINKKTYLFDYDSSKEDNFNLYERFDLPLFIHKNYVAYRSGKINLAYKKGDPNYIDWYLHKYYYQNDSIDKKRVKNLDAFNEEFYWTLKDTNLILKRKNDTTVQIVDSKTNQVIIEDVTKWDPLLFNNVDENHKYCLTPDHKKLLKFDRISDELDFIYDIEKNKLTFIKDIKVN